MIYKFLAILLPLMLGGCATLAPKLIPFDDLPAPSGDYGVGTQVFYWTDSNRLEWFTAAPDDVRRLVVQAWYPINAEAGGSHDRTEFYPYVDHPAQRLAPLAKQMGLPQFLMAHIQHVATNSLLDAAPAVSLGPLPLILFSHGLGGMRAQNTVQAEELASLGYMVVAVDHPYDAYLTLFADGSMADYRSGAEGQLTVDEFWALRTPQLATRTADMRYLLDHIASLQAGGDNFWRLADLGRVGIFGHSYGGATSVMVAATDSRIKAILALDGWMLPIPQDKIDAGLGVPFLYIGRRAWDDPLNYKKLDQLLASSPAATEHLLDNTKHMDFSDTPQFSTVAKTFGISGKMPRQEIRQLLNTELVTFFNTYVRDAGI
jgi:dienelactone hydrolase